MVAARCRSRVKSPTVKFSHVQTSSKKLLNTINSGIKCFFSLSYRSGFCVRNSKLSQNILASIQSFLLNAELYPLVPLRREPAPSVFQWFLSCRADRPSTNRTGAASPKHRPLSLRPVCRGVGQTGPCEGAAQQIPLETTAPLFLIHI